MKVKLTISILLVNVLFGFSQDLANSLFENHFNTTIHSDTLAKYKKQCDAILVLHPQDLNTLFSKALISDFEGNYSKARTLYQTLIALDSTHSEAYFNLAASYLNEFERLEFIPKFANDTFSNEKGYWKCKGEPNKCLQVAEQVQPLLERSFLLDSNSPEEDLSIFREMNFTLLEFIKLHE